MRLNGVHSFILIICIATPGLHKRSTRRRSQPNHGDIRQIWVAYRTEPSCFLTVAVYPKACIPNGRGNNWECVTLCSRSFYTWDQKLTIRGRTKRPTANQSRDRAVKYSQLGRGKANEAAPDQCSYCVIDSLRDMKPVQGIQHVGRYKIDLLIYWLSEQSKGRPTSHFRTHQMYVNYKKWYSDNKVT